MQVLNSLLPDEDLLKNTLQSLPSVATDNVTPLHMKFLNDRGLPISSNDNNDDISDKSKPTATATNERGDPIANGNDHWSDSIAASALNSSDVRVVRVGRDGFGVKCDGGEACWRPMVTTHWPRLLRHFGYVVKSRSVQFIIHHVVFIIFHMLIFILMPTGYILLAKIFEAFPGCVSHSSMFRTCIYDDLYL